MDDVPGNNLQRDLAALSATQVARRAARSADAAARDHGFEYLGGEASGFTRARTVTFHWHRATDRISCTVDSGVVHAHLLVYGAGTRVALRSLRSALRAANPDTDTRTLTRLSRSPEPTVRRCAAGNPSTPPKTLARLVEDGSPLVVAAAVRNPSTPDNAVAFHALHRN